MKVQYRLYKRLSALKEAGFDIPDDSVVFVISDDDKRFEELKKILGDSWLDNVINTDTDFTENERSESRYLAIEATKMLGYPQPEDWEEDEREEEPKYPFDIYPYFENVFDVANVSRDYGMLRGKQIGDFSLLGEPKWGKSDIGSIFWCGDVFFSTPSIYKQIFEPLGIGCRTVLGYGNRKPLTTVVQLIPQGVSNSKLIIKEDQITESTDIPEWGIKKYILNSKGFFPSFEQNPGNYDFFVSQEYFGSSEVNEKASFISQKLYRLLKKHAVKGLNYYPQDAMIIDKADSNRVREINKWVILE
jgi:hypothetical protein